MVVVKLESLTRSQRVRHVWTSQSAEPGPVQGREETGVRKADSLERSRTAALIEDPGEKSGDNLID